MIKPSPFRYFKTSLEIIRLAVMLHVQFPLWLRKVEDLLHERGVDVSHETVRYWWHRFGPKLAVEIRKRRISSMRKTDGDGDGASTSGVNSAPSDVRHVAANSDWFELV